jgi:hypothetical protein
MTGRYAYFWNSHWAVTRYGLQAAYGQPRYDIAAKRLLERRPCEPQFYDWPLHMADKDGPLGPFIEAFKIALDVHKRKLKEPVGQDQLERSIAEAWRLRRESWA